MSFKSFSDILLSPNIASKYLWLSLDSLPFLLQNKLRRRSQINNLFDSFFKILDRQSKYDLIILPSFTFDFGSTHLFDTSLSSPSVNSFSRFLFSLKYPLRSIHPFYSFYCFGKLAESFCSNTFFDSVGSNSIFSYLNSSEFTLLSIGHHYAKALSNIHQIEYQLQVPYRTLCYIKGILSRNSDPIERSSFSFYSRLNQICEFSGLTELGVNRLDVHGISNSFLHDYNGQRYGYYTLELNKFTSFILSEHLNLLPLVSAFHPDLQPPISMPFLPERSNLAYTKFILS